MTTDIFPREVTGNVPRVTLTGQERLHVEQHRGLIAYSQEEIIFRTAAGLLRTKGEQLRFSLYTSGEALVLGRIEVVEYVHREGRS